MTQDPKRRPDAALDAPTADAAPLEDDFLSPEHVLANMPHIPEPAPETPAEEADSTPAPAAENAAHATDLPPNEDLVEVPSSWEVEIVPEVPAEALIPPPGWSTPEPPAASTTAPHTPEAPPTEAAPPREQPAAPPADTPPAAPPAPPSPSAPPPVTEDASPASFAQIPVVPAPRTEVVLDCSAGRMLLARGELTLLGEKDGLDRFRLWVADTRDTLGPGAIRVDAPPKYAPLLARRLLARGGELDDASTLLPLSRKRLGPNQTLLGFHLMTSAEKARLAHLHAKSSQGLLVHDASSLLFGILRHERGTVAGFLQFPGSITALVVRQGHVLWGRRQMLAEDQGPAWANAVRALQTDITFAGKENGFEVEETLWVAGLTSTRDLPLEDARALPVCALRTETGTQYSALPLAHAHHGASLTSPAERLAAALRPWEPLAWGTMLLVGLFLAVGGLWLNSTAAGLAHQAEGLAARKAELLRDLAQVQQETAFSAERAALAQGVYATAQAVLQAEVTLPMAAVWNDLAHLKPEACRLLTLEMHYEASGVRVQLTGGIELPMTQAQAVFDAFQRELNAKGYTVAAANLHFDMDGNAFTLTLHRSFENSPCIPPCAPY
ncbi:hypothetical protein TDMWS_21610 [Thermodesulfomicrobium sp. WS]|uniref:hypothetical protein n=1 Tax=Thermodesulfomicrobium sp. WS TaxID=3004129 RepID=UPI0024938A80|nr:hypothetical protein [Thermodesulfomicrobium sp. WS]BDV02076.1 hypothetical protein TDMWS_21610 [Thermodesulfomicrobium sp. WS]